MWRAHVIKGYFGRYVFRKVVFRYHHVRAVSEREYSSHLQNVLNSRRAHRNRILRAHRFHDEPMRGCVYCSYREEILQLQNWGNQKRFWAEE